MRWPLGSKSISSTTHGEVRPNACVNSSSGFMRDIRRGPRDVRKYGSKIHHGTDFHTKRMRATIFTHIASALLLKYYLFLIKPREPL